MNEEEELFVFDEKSTKRLIRKAKTKSLVKIVSLIVVIVPIVFVVILYTLYQLSNKHGINLEYDIKLYEELTRPNVYVSNQALSFDLTGGEIRTQTYKLIGDRPYIWETIEGQYNLFGQYSNDSGASNTIMLDGSSSLKETNQFTLYNVHTGDREVRFYHPNIAYDSVKNAVNQLDKLDANLDVELALSFDQAYTLEEVKTMLPSTVQQRWYWVDGYSEHLLSFIGEEQGTISAKYPYLYGFRAEFPWQKETGSGDEIDAFIFSVNRLYNNDNFKRKVVPLYETIIGSNQQLDREDVKIIGVVVTGTVKELSSLQEESYIRASTFGVIADFRYESGIND